MNTIMKFISTFGCLMAVQHTWSFNTKLYHMSKQISFFSTRMKIHMKKEKKVKFHSVYTPKNANQEKYVEYLNNPDTNIIISIGPAGTGKTMFGCIKAIHELQYGNIDKIVVTRPLVTVEEELGFLPGDILKKMDPWTRPIFDIFLEHISKTELNSMLYNNIIEISPLAFMRGRTFKNSFIIADEMQNSSPNQMKMLTSRLGENSRMVITGDLKQTDRQIHDNGLQDFITKYKAYQRQMTNKDTIQLIEFETADIERSRAVQEIINMYNYRETPTLLHKEPSNICNLEYKPKKPLKIWETE